MLKPQLIFILSFTFCFFVKSQSQNCKCKFPKSDYGVVFDSEPDTVFHLLNGKTIILCGDKNLDTFPVTFSEFILGECGKDSIIDFWDAKTNCLIKASMNSLFVEEYVYLPIGENFKYLPTLWITTKIHFAGERMVKKLILNKRFPKYNKEKISKVLLSYEMAKPNVNDSADDIEAKLFIAAISGSKKARSYFNTFKTKFEIFDGAYLEDYEDWQAMLALWDDKK